MTQLNATSELRDIWLKYATEVADISHDTASSRINLVREIDDEGYPIIDQGELDARNLSPDWVNCFWMVIFSTFVWEVSKYGFNLACTKLKKMKPDDFQKRLTDWKESERKTTELIEKTFEFVEQNEEAIKDYLRQLNENES